MIQLAALNPRLRGSIPLTDVHAPWLVHLAQEQVWALAASGASDANVKNVGHALRWFALFPRTQWPDEGRIAPQRRPRRCDGLPGVVESACP